MNKHRDELVSMRRPVVAAWGTSGHDAPVFVDDSGRRAHGVRLAGATIAMLCACWLATLVFGMSGLTSLPGPRESALARALPAPGRMLAIEPLRGAKLRWADHAPGTSGGGTLELADWSPPGE
jgi:hypothetical protein